MEAGNMPFDGHGLETAHREGRSRTSVQSQTVS